jgi:hypothetical protein
MFNIPSSNIGAFILGNGNFPSTKSNLIYASGSQVQITGSLIVTGSLILSATQSTAPSYTGTDGEIVPATVGGQYFLYMWMNGAWRSGSFV